MVQQTFKDSGKEASLIRTRLWLSIIFSLLIACGLLSRIYYLQVIDYQELTTLSNDNRIFIQPIPPTRGLIYDSEGNLIAKNIPSFTLSIVPDRVKSLQDTLSKLQKLITISQDDISDFNRLKKQHRPFEAIPLKYQLTESEIAKISVDQYNLPGVEIQAQLIRYYPYNNLFADVVGYVGRINNREEKILDPNLYSGTHITGKSGLERYYETTLLGKPGYREAEVDVRGRVRRILKEVPPKTGQNLHLYINLSVQKAAAKAMEGRRGAVVAIDPRTGGIIAMVSTPSFNPNLFVTGISYKAYNALNADKARPLFNRATLGTYPPASTIKPIMALAGLDQNVITPEWKIFDPGFYQLPGFKHRYRNWKRSGQGWVNLHKAIMKSNDTYFYQVAVKLGITNIHKYTTMFGYGEKPDIDFPSLSTGLMPSIAWKKRAYNQPWYPGETVIAGIGQGYMQATPLQLAISSATLANRGHTITPRIAEPGPGVPPIKPSITIDASSADWKAIIGAMKDVISPQGTGWRMGKVPFTVAGKTGTAQVISIAQGERYNKDKLKKSDWDHGLFIAFAPVDHPQIALAVVTENQDKAAVPVAKRVLEAYFKSKEAGKALPDKVNTKTTPDNLKAASISTPTQQHKQE